MKARQLAPLRCHISTYREIQQYLSTYLLALLLSCAADPKNDGKLNFDGRSVTVPQGKPVAMTQFNNSSFWQSEYLVYQESQVRIRYLLTFRR